MRRLFLLASVLVLVAPHLARAQDPPPSAAADPSNPSGRKYPPRVYRTVPLAGVPPVIDGRLDDAAWDEGEWAGDFRQHIPTEGAAPSQPTELKVLHDDRYIYMAIRVHDDPALVHRYPGRRDDFSGDIVGICFDSYNDKRTGFEFDLTAGGSKIDLILGNGEMEWDTTWDGVWDGKVSHHAGGWDAEFRVPLNQLRYGSVGEQVWGMHAWRWIERLQEESQWQLIPRQNTGRMHQLGELRGLDPLPRVRHVELLPYALGKATTGPSAGGDTDLDGVLGLDAKVALSPAFTLDATVNPDFGQVEADPSVVNLSAYETFYEEKRPFFLEGRKTLTLGIDGEDQLFYSRRIGAPPTGLPFLPPGETSSLPESTTILGAFKVSGKTAGGLSLAVLQAITQEETVTLGAPGPPRDVTVEPLGSYTVGRLHKDWGKGNTSLGAMVTSTHRWVDGLTRALLPGQATTGGVDLAHYLDNRTWLVEASGVASHVTGDAAAITALQTNAVHYFQRPDATHLDVDTERTSLGGHGGRVQFGRSDSGRFRVSDAFHWYSPGLELNDVGFLRQADVLANQLVVGWRETAPRGIFRNYGLEASREDRWDFGGLAVRSSTEVEASGQFRNLWGAELQYEYVDAVDTRMLRGGPALRWHAYDEVSASAHTDQSRRVSVSLGGWRAWAREPGTDASNVNVGLNVRPSNRLSLSASASYDHLLDTLQYVATADAAGDPRWVLGRLDQDTWSFTLRANLSITPDFTVQYYGSPYIGTGRYDAFKRATDTLAQQYTARFHLYGPDEITYVEEANAYRVTESGGASFVFDNPDFSFRQFRSNLVARWEWKPGSSLYLVWSQGRTSGVPRWDASFADNWDALWGTRPDNVFLVKASYWVSP